MLKFLKRHRSKFFVGLGIVLGYVAHLSIETFVLTNVVSYFGGHIPVIV